MRQYLSVITSKKDQFACTPPSLLNMIQMMFWRGAAAFDPCPASPEFDGLAVAWKSRNFVNPPFSNIAVWAHKSATEPGNTVLLMLARPSTVYLRDTIIPACSSIVLLCNPVCFVPYITPILVPIMLVNFHGKQPVSCSGLRLRRVAFEHWDLPADNTYIDHFLPHVKSTFRVERLEEDQDMPTFLEEGCTYLCVMHSPMRVLTACTAHCNKFPTATVVLLIIPAFNTSYFRKCMYMVQMVVFITPKLIPNSFLGSVIVVISRKGHPKKKPALYLACSTTDNMFGPD